MTTTQPTLDLSNLPMAAALDFSLPVAQVRDAWQATVTYLDQLRAQPGVAFSTELGTQLDTTRYQANLALEAIKLWQGGGGTGAETATTVPNLAAPAEGFRTALASAKAMWTTEFGGVVQRPGLLAQVTASRDPSWYLLWGGAALVLYLLTMKR